MDLSRPLTDLHEICTQVWCGVKAEYLISKFFSLTLKNLAPIIYLKLSTTAVNRKRGTSTRLNISTDKYYRLSSTINALQNGSKLVVITAQGFDAT